MDRQRWAQIEELFQAALERPAAERNAYLAEACAGDAELRAEVEALLRQDGASSPLDRPAWEQAGTALGPYRILGRLGTGGMGQVFRATDTRLNRTVAVKILHPELAARPDFRRRFEREARAGSALNHPHICGLYDIGEQDGVSYIVMEYVEGETLARRIEAGALPFADTLRYGAEIADALAAAHAAGVVHRDLKPANLVITSGGIKVLDFGLAKFQSSPGNGQPQSTATITSEQAIVGTLAYMAPEQLEGHEADTRTDIFALGLVLHEMASGRRAFTAESQAGLIAEILRGDPAPLAGAPPQFAHVVRRCLMRDPARRWQSAGDVKLELLECASPPVDHPAPRLPSARVRLTLLWSGSVAAAWWAGASLTRDPAAVNLSGYRLSPVAAGGGSAASPMWSPDGKSIAFVAQEGAKRALFVQALGSTAAVAVTGPEVDVSAFFPGFWTPDGQFLYFTGARDRQSGVFRVSVGGGEAELVRPNALRATISPDGRALVLLVETADGFRVQVADPSGAQSRDYAPLPFEAGQWKGRPCLAFAPDGRKLLVLVDTEQRRESWLLPWPPARARRVFEGAMLGPAPQFSWMPDSRHVVVTAAVERGHSQLYMADTGGGRPWRILAQDRPVAFAAVSPEGGRIAYQSSLSTAEVVAAPVSGEPPRTLLGGSRSQQMADHSPAASQLVFVTDRRGVPEVWLANLNDGEQRPLLSPGDIRVGHEPASGFATPVFSPDGRRVAVAAVSATGAAIYTTPSAGTMPVRATAQVNPSEFAPTWSPDGRWLAFWHPARTEMRLAKVRPGSGEPPVDLAPCWNRTVPAWSPTNDWIAFHDPAGHLTVISPDGKERRTLGGSGAIAWGGDGRVIYQARSDTRKLVAVDVTTGAERVIRELGDLGPFSSVNAGWRASMTPDGKEFIYTVSRAREEIWLLEGVTVPVPWYRRWL